MANSLQDQYDPDQAIHRQMIGFSELIKRNVRETISYRYETYRTIPTFRSHVSTTACGL